MWWTSILCSLTFFTVVATAQPLTPERSKTSSIEQIRVPKARSEHDVSYQYYLALLRRVLELGAQGRPMPTIVQTLEMEQGRVVRELSVHRSIDLMWAGVDAEKNQQLRAIPYPLERGLMGFRKFTIHRDLASTLDGVTTLKPLQKLITCQGLAWPDNQILRQAHFRVMTSPVYENLFKQVNARRCDLFPRGLHEGDAELSERQALYPNLQRYQDMMLHYPMAIYFYTRQGDEELALWLETGLREFNARGEHLRFMQSQPLTAHVFPLKKHRSSRWFELENPDLASAAVQDRRYWFTAEDFKD